MTRTTTSRRRRAAVAISAAAALTAAGCQGGMIGSDAEHVLVAGHQLAAGTPFDEGMNEFARLVEEKTDGRVEVDAHPNAALGTEPEMFQGMQTGTIDVAIIAPGSIAEFVPEVSLLSMPFLVIDREQRDAVIEGQVAERLEQILLETSDTVPLTYFGGSYRQMFFTEPVESMEDVAGRLFRVQPAAVLTDSFAAAGLVPSVVSYDELYNALQQGVVDGADNEAVFIDSQNFDEPAPHILQTNHEVTIRPLLVAHSTMEELGDELGPLVLEAAEEAGEYQRELEEEEDDEILADLAQRDGVTVVEADTTDLIDDVEPIWQRYAASWGVQDTLEQIIDLRPEG